MRLIDLDEFLRQNCIGRMEGKSCEECKHHVLEVSCERLMEQPTAEMAGKWIKIGRSLDKCSVCGDYVDFARQCGYNYCPHCGALMDEVTE